MIQRGDKIRATWDDGLVLEGVYKHTERGYVILTANTGGQIVCGKSVKLEVINDEKPCIGIQPRRCD
jgi:hypothetical protein